uniref:Uncharacterized protein n=1 Tax=Oryza nivara TaxID=4536 RepID=A0A0E0HYD2_ORYNI
MFAGGDSVRSTGTGTGRDGTGRRLPSPAQLADGDGDRHISSIRSSGRSLPPFSFSHSMKHTDWRSTSPALCCLSLSPTHQFLKRVLIRQRLNGIHLNTFDFFRAKHDFCFVLQLLIRIVLVFMIVKSNSVAH